VEKEKEQWGGLSLEGKGKSGKKGAYLRKEGRKRF